MRPQDTGWNFLSVSIILPSVYPSGRPQAIFDFCDNFQSGGLALWRIYYALSNVRKYDGAAKKYEEPR